MGILPNDVEAKIIARRDQGTTENNDGEDKKVDQPSSDETKDEKKNDDSDSSKSSKKTSAQSIAQIAGVEDPENDDDDDDDDDKSDKKGKNKSGIFKELIETKRELRQVKRESVDTQLELMKQMDVVLKELDNLKRSGSITKEEKQEEIDSLLEDLEQNYGLDRTGFEKMATALQRKFGITSSSKTESKGDDDTRTRLDKLERDRDDERNRNQAKERNSAVEKAIESEYASLIEDHPEIKETTSLAAIKRYITSNEMNLYRSMEEIVREMYPKAIGGKAGIDGYSGTRESDNNEEIDPNDPETERKLRKNPEFRKKYQDDLRKRIRANYRA